MRRFSRQATCSFATLRVEFRGKRTPLALKAYNEEGLFLKGKNTESKKETEYKSNEIIKRDLNGSLNILYKGKCILEGKEIPKYMQRPKYTYSGRQLPF